MPLNAINFQSARKLNSFKKGILHIKWVSFYILIVSFFPNPTFSLFSFMFNFVNILGPNNLKKEEW